MKQNQEVAKSSAKINDFMTKFLQFFRIRMLRYSISKQLKSASSYVLVIITLIAAYGCLVIAFLTKNFGSAEAATGNAIIFKYAFFMVYFTFFTILISFKSVQMIRDEIDDGTLLIFNSMPYSRARMIVEKWLSVQIVCLLYSTVIILIPISSTYLLANLIADSDTVLNLKAILSLMNTMFLTSFIIQLLLSTFAILLSLVLSGKATSGLVSTFGAFAFIGIVVPMILSGVLGPRDNTFNNLN